MLNNKLKDWFWKILLLTHEVMELLGLLDVEVSVVLVEVPEFVEDDDLTVCKDRGYLVTVVYQDNFGRMKYHEKRFKQPRRVGSLIDFKF